MKKILFATDFSPTADNAFIYAVELAKHINAELTTIHAYQRPDISAIDLPNTLRRVYDDLQMEEFENYRDSIPRLRQIETEHGLAESQVRHVLTEGETVKVIVNHAQQGGYDYIVMGTKGASGLKEIFLGTITEGVVEQSSVPVLAIPDEALFDGDLNKIGFTTDYQPAEKAVLLKVFDFAQLINAEVHVLHVDLANTSDLYDEMTAWKRDLPITYPKAKFITLEGDDLEDALEKYSEEKQLDLIAMLQHKRGFFASVFERNLAKEMVNHLEVPILSFSEKVMPTEGENPST